MTVPHERLAHDHAFAPAQTLLATIAHLLPQQVHPDALEAFYELAKAEIGRYEAAAERTRQRLSPVTNERRTS